MPKQSLEKKKEQKGMGTILSFLLAFFGANLCIAIIEFVTGEFPPPFIIWELIYTVILYKKFKNYNFVASKEIKNVFRKV